MSAPRSLARFPDLLYFPHHIRQPYEILQFLLFASHTMHLQKHTVLPVSCPDIRPAQPDKSAVHVAFPLPRMYKSASEPILTYFKLKCLFHMISSTGCCCHDHFDPPTFFAAVLSPLLWAVPRKNRSPRIHL